MCPFTVLEHAQSQERFKTVKKDDAGDDPCQQCFGASLATDLNQRFTVRHRVKLSCMASTGSTSATSVQADPKLPKALQRIAVPSCPVSMPPGETQECLSAQ